MIKFYKHLFLKLSFQSIIMKRKVKGGILATIGYLLSPLSWWNDLIINLPLAYLFGLLFGLISKSLFLPMIIFGYWLTNVAGFMIMHHGLKDLKSKKKSKPTKNELLKDIGISLLYTIIVVILVWIGWLKFPTEYFR